MPAALYPQEDSWYSFLLEAKSTPGPSAARMIRSIEKSNDLIGNRSRDLSAIFGSIFIFKWDAWEILSKIEFESSILKPTS
jgi:hypothetical protein